MSSFGVLNRQTRDIAALMVVMLATVMSAFVPALASAAQMTERSVALSSSSVSAVGVSYQTTFTASASAGAVVVQFCSNSPLIGDVCDAPGGFSAASATASGGATISGTSTANQVVVTDTIASGSNSFTLGNITNPNTAGSLYARILTYTDTTAAGAYSVDSSTSAIGTPIDQGAVAISINNTIGVGGAVLESMTFCVSGETITNNCVGSGASAPALTAPTLKLGKDTGGVVALASDNVYSGTIYTQISTNAYNGAIVSLKSSATDCGGLINSSDPTKCYIGPATSDITAGQALFGVKTGAAATDPTNGTIQPVGSYNASTYYMGYTAGNTAGVTSTYGDSVLNTNSKPANNMNMPLTFGASVSNNTPAGNYSADMSLIATGTF